MRAFFKRLVQALALAKNEVRYVLLIVAVVWQVAPALVRLIPHWRSFTKHPPVNHSPIRPFPTCGTTEPKYTTDRKGHFVLSGSKLTPKFKGQWFPGNLMGRPLRGTDFSRWYSEGDKTEAGLLPPGSVAVCDVNSHAFPEFRAYRLKWAFIAVDNHGNDYFVEAIVPTNILKYVYSEMVQQCVGETTSEAAPSAAPEASQR